MFPYFTIFGKTVGMYAILAIIGLAVCTAVCTLLTQKKGVMFEDCLLLLLVVAGGLTVGGHLLYGLTQLDRLVLLLKNIGKLTLIEFFQGLGIVFGGSVFYGGFLGALGALLIYSHFVKILPRGDLLDLYAVTVPLFHTFGRIGCFFGGCCYGIESAFGYTVTGNTLIPELNGVRRFPVQLTEAACNLLIFLLLFRLYRKEKNRGRLIFTYMLCYAPVRFSLEFLRGDVIRGIYLGLSTSQWISLALFAVGAVGTVVGTIRIRKKASPESV